MQDPDRLRRRLPSVERLAGDHRLSELGLAPEPLRNAIRLVLSEERERLVNDGIAPIDPAGDIVATLVARYGHGDSHVINATGVLIHTNLGRVPVSRETAEAMAASAAASNALEVDLETGRRGDRQERVGRFLRTLTDCEAALVVNNNAAAVMLVVAALSADRDAIVSRGEAVEIGGGFRIPDVLRQGGARLVEVGTTNRTYDRDYREACSPSTGILLKVSPSNFVISGYTHATSIRELAAIGRERGVPVVEDQGNGLLRPVRLSGLDFGRSLADALAEGADIVTASGDKLLGGPQAGLILGQADLVRRIAQHPLARAVRVDKVTLSGLETTLMHYLQGAEASKVPLWRMVTGSVEELQRRAERIAASVGPLQRVDIRPTVATFGGGALPGQTIPSVAIQLQPPGGTTAGQLGTRLRRGEPPLWGRIEADQVLLDLRSVLPEDDCHVAEALRAAVT